MSTANTRTSRSRGRRGDGSHRASERGRSQSSGSRGRCGVGPHRARERGRSQSPSPRTYRASREGSRERYRSRGDRLPRGASVGHYRNSSRDRHYGHRSYRRRSRSSSRERRHQHSESRHRHRSRSYGRRHSGSRTRRLTDSRDRRAQRAYGSSGRRYGGRRHSVSSSPESLRRHREGFPRSRSRSAQRGRREGGERRGATRADDRRSNPPTTPPPPKNFPGGKWLDPNIFIFCTGSRPQ